MKNFLTLCLLCFGTTLFSQDFSKTLQSSKWYPSRDAKTNALVYYKKSPVKSPEEILQFKSDGKIRHCGTTMESFLDASGKEIITTHFMCDSVEAYEIKNGMLRTQLLKQTPRFYKLAMKGENIELSAIKEEDYK